MQLIYVHSAKIKTTNKCGIFNIYLFFICFMCMCACMCRCVYVGQLAEVSFFLPPCVFQETSGHQAHSKSSHPQSCILLPNSKALRMKYPSPVFGCSIFFFFLLRKQPKYTATFRKKICGCFSDYFTFSDSEHIVICFPVKCLDLACVLLPKINKLKVSLMNLGSTGETVFLH